MCEINEIKKLLLINDNHLKEALKYYNKTESDVKQDVEILKEWLKTEPHLPDDEG